MTSEHRSHTAPCPTLAPRFEALSTASDGELLSGVTKLVGSHRELTARLVAHLAEIEERRLHLQAGFSSMFDFCVNELRLGEGEAFRRILAARLGHRFPIVYSLLASGALHLSALELLRERLTEENHVELFDAASGKSKREVAELLAARFPRPDLPSRIRKLPDGQSPLPAAESSDGSSFALEPSTSGPSVQPRRDRIEPLSEARYRIEFTASAELREKLELCRDLMSHANPSRELGMVVERAIDLLLPELERRRLARTKRSPRQPRAPVDEEVVDRRAKPGRVTNAARRHVFERDGTRCTYVSPEGRRCEARAFLELDHVEPRALGGGDESENLRVRCRAHNQLWAEQAYGRERIESSRHFCQQKRQVKRTVSGTSECSRGVLERVRLALVGMGFRNGQARRAIVLVERAHCGAEQLAIEQALREALLAATETAA